MCKFSRWTAALLIGTAIVDIAALPATAADEFAPAQTRVQPQPNDDLICYMQTADGRTLNLSAICGQNVVPGSNAAVSTTAPSSSSLGGLESFRQAAGVPPCYVFDAQGLPCPPAQ